MKAFRILTLHAFPSNDVAGLYAFSVTSMDFMPRGPRVGPIWY